MCLAKCHVRVPLSIFFCILADAMQCDAPQYILYWICEMKCMLNMSFIAKFVFCMAYTVAVWWLWILITEQKKWFRWQNRLVHRKFICFGTMQQPFYSHFYSRSPFFATLFCYVCRPVLPLAYSLPSVRFWRAHINLLKLTRGWNKKKFTIEDE